MNTHPTPRLIGLRHAFNLLVLAALPCALSGQTWIGGATDSDWSTTANWSATAVPSNDGTADITFAATATGASTVNTPWSVASLLFNNTGALTLSGSDLTVRRTASGGYWVNSAATNVTKKIENNLNLVYDNVSGSLSSSLGGGNGGLQLTGNLTLSTTGAATPTSILLQLRGSGANSIGGNIQFADGTPAQRTLAKTDAGTWTVGGTANNFTNITINHGALKFASAAALPATVALGFTATGNGFNPTLDLNGQQLTVASLTAVKPGSSTNTRSRVTGSGRLSVTGQIAANDLNGGWLEINAVVDSATGVTIAANAGLAGTGSISLAENGSIQISGDLTPGAVASSGGVIASTAGTLTLGLSGTGKLNFAAGSSLKFDLGATSAASDKITFVTAGDWLSGSGNATLALTGGDAIDYAATYTLFENVTTAGFVFASITGYDDAAYTAQLALVGGNYQLSFVSSAIPEPAHAAILLSIAGFAMIALRRRR